MKKSTAIISFLLVLACMCGLGYIMMYGIDKNQSGATKETKLGLDLAGGVSITYQIVGDGASEEAVDDTIMKLRKRIDKYSTESQVYKEGIDRISIEIPGVTDADAILADLGSPGQLYFIKATGIDATTGQMVPNYTYMTTPEGLSVYREADVAYAYDSKGKCYEYDAAKGDFKTNQYGDKIPYKVEDSSRESAQLCLTRSIEELEADGSIVLTGLDVAEAEGGSISDEKDGVQHIVSLTFNDEGAKKFAEVTGEALQYSYGTLQNTIAIYYDGEIISSPNVVAQITNGTAQITGMESQKAAQALAQNIRIGGLKVELQELRSNVVGAQLGGEAITTSIKAGIVGLIIVILFMIVVYGVPGFASAIALVMYTMLTMVLINFMGITMTLPGIAGIILSIGMAVDANVIIFARIREEIGAGSNVENAIKAGFSKALSAIIDGNITTLIAAIVLMVMGSGSIKGFAYTLTLGIVLSMISAIFVTKLLINIFYAFGFKNKKFYGQAKDKTPVNFLGKRRIYITISSALIVLGIGVMLFFRFGSASKQPLNFGLEFAGGSATTVDFPTELDTKVVDTEIAPKLGKLIGDNNVQWTTVQNSNAIIFKTKALEENEGIREEITKMFVENYNVQPDGITIESISSTISSEMQKEALIAIIVASLCMLVYIWFRFSDYRFGASAVIALIHDVMIVITFYACARITVGSTFIACLLTIVGYSINATIVIFDRIRENKKKMGRKDTLEDVINKSITQTLTRSLFTSLTTFIMVVVLFIFGVSSIKEFALPLMIGIISGTYSSVCLTGSMWWMLRKAFPYKEGEED